MAKFTAQQVIDALIDADGVISDAAHALKASRTTIHKYINDYPTVAEALEDVREATLDYVEGKLMEQIGKGNMTAIIFYLKTQGKARGYVERQEVTGADGGPLSFSSVEIVKTDDGE